MALDYSTLIHIISLHTLRQSATTPYTLNTGDALLGRLRVTERTEKYQKPPFHIPPGSLVFGDAFGQGRVYSDSPTDTASKEGTDEIRCEALCPQPSWFATDIMVLFTQWRYIPPPSALCGDESSAWAYIEVISPPILLPLSFRVPNSKHMLSWWTENQVYPDADNEKRFIDAFQMLPPETADSAVQLLRNQKSRHEKFKTHNNCNSSGVCDSDSGIDKGQQYKRSTKKPRKSTSDNSETASITGRVVALSSLICSSSNKDDGETLRFLVNVEIDATARYDNISARISRSTSAARLIQVPILVIGRRFLNMFASLCIDDSVFVTCLKTATIYADGSKAEAVFATSSLSNIFKIDGFECLDDIQTNALCSPQTTFTQASQGALLASVASDESKGDNCNISSCSSLACDPQTSANQGSRSVGTSSQFQHLSGDKHLLVNKGKLESYSGEITSVVDFMMGIYVIDGVHLLMLTYWPLLSPLLPLREGTRVVVDNAHVILLSNSRCYNWEWFDKVSTLQQHADLDNDEKRVLVFGACARSSVRILEFSASSTPIELSCILDRSLVAAVVDSSPGLVQMIESIEAYWNLQAKFPAGLLNNYMASEAKGHPANAQVIEMALLLTKGADNLKANRAARNLCIEFLSHQKSCCVDAIVVPEPMRVVTLRKVIQRFVSWQSRQKEPGVGSKEESIKTLTEEVQVVKVYPSSLQLEKIPIISRVVVNDRGSICLEDATGTIKILPHFGSRVNLGLATHYLTFPSQQHIGHVYAWNSWYFINENVDVSGMMGKDGRLSSMKLEPANSMFSLVYASVSDPLMLHVDDTFGGVSGGSGTASGLLKKSIGPLTKKHSSENISHCFVFLVRSATSQLCRTNPKDKRWQVRKAVSGVAFKADFQRLHSQLTSQRPSETTLEKLDLGTVCEKDFDECVLIFSLGEVPALLEPGTAYVVCLQSLSQNGNSNGRISVGKPISGAGSVTYIKLGGHDHIHPVNIAISGPSWDTKQLYGMSGSSSELLSVPFLTVYTASDSAFDRVKMGAIYSVRDIHRYGSEATDSRLQHGKTVSVTGVISKRELLEATAFESSASGTTPDADSSKNPSRTTAVTGCFKTLLVLQDHTDTTHSISLYIRLTSISHSLGLVPGSRITARNATLSISRSTGKAYLTASSTTDIQTALVNATMPLEYESASSLDSCTASDDGDVVEVPFVGQLYSQRRFQRRRIFLSGCYIDNVFSIQIIIICTKCGQAVCNMQCCCGTKSLRVLKRLASNSPANETVCAEISVTAQVSDGSGIALLALSGAEALCELLQLMLSDLESLYQASAQSLDGKLVWRQQRWQGETNQLNEVQGGIGCAVAAATKSAILRIEGTLQSTEAAVDDVPAWSVVKQPIRLGGQDLVVNRYSTVTITAHKVVRISVAELCWKFLEVLDER